MFFRHIWTEKLLADGVCQTIVIWCVWYEEFVQMPCCFLESACSVILQEINAQKRVNLQFWSQKVVILACHCCIKTIPILIKAMFDTSDIILRTMGYDLGVVVLTVSSVQ